MVANILPPTSIASTSFATSGTLTLSTGTTITYTGGSEIKVHTIKMWFVKDMQYYIKNTGSDNITVRITAQLTPNGDEVSVITPTTLAPGDSLPFYYDRPAYYLNIYVTPTSDTSEWKDEYVVRW